MIVVEIIGHRGASYLAPENTLASVKLAWEEGADVVEVDVHLSQDNRLVVIHDSSTKRVAGVDLEVRQTTFEELRKLDVGRFKGQQYAGERIPCLEGVIAAIPPNRRLFVEVKCGPEILPILQKAIAESGKTEQIAVIGFNLETITAFKQIMPQIPVYWLRSTERDAASQEWLPHNPELVETVLARRLDGLNLHYAGVTKDLVDAIKAAGLRIYVWTVNDLEEAERFKDLGVDGIATDRPELLLRMLGKPTAEVEN